jgi:hypothetical protein
VAAALGLPHMGVNGTAKLSAKDGRHQMCLLCCFVFMVAKLGSCHEVPACLDGGSCVPDMIHKFRSFFGELQYEKVRE